MFAPTNILPQVSQITFSPQQSAIAPQDPFATAAAGMQVLDAPIRRELQREQIASMQHQRMLAQRAAQVRDEEFAFQKEKYAQEQADAFESRLNESVKIYNEFTGMEFSNPYLHEKVNAIFEAEGINSDFFTAMLDAPDRVSLKPYTDKMRRAFSNPEVQQAIRMETAYQNLLGDVAKNGKNYDLNAVNTFMNEYETFSEKELKGKNISSFNPAKFRKQEDPTEVLLEKHRNIAGTTPGAYSNPTFEKKFEDDMAEIGMDPANAKKLFDDIYGFGDNSEMYRRIAVNDLYGTGASEEQINEAAQFYGDVFQEAFQSLGKKAATDLLSETYKKSLTNANALRTAELRNKLDMLRDAAKPSGKSGGSSGGTKKSKPNPQGVFNSNVTKVLPSASITDPQVGVFIHNKTKKSNDFAAGIKISPTKYTYAGRTKEWSNVTPDEATEILMGVVATGLIELGGYNELEYILDQQTRMDNDMPVDNFQLETRYTSVPPSDFKFSASNGEVVTIMGDVSNLYYIDQSSGNLITTDASMSPFTIKDSSKNKKVFIGGVPRRIFSVALHKQDPIKQTVKRENNQSQSTSSSTFDDWI